LVNETSPYLLQHVENPVDWHPWGDEALNLAKSLDKPIFLSIGYSACHWCHVMAHESFEDPVIAALLNESFICIKVDREERPDLDAIYMSAVVAMTGSGGWPMSVFLTPSLEPFYGGTYFPPAPHFNLPGFRDVLVSISRLWREDRQKLLESANEVTQHIQRQAGQPTAPAQNMTLDMLEKAVLKLAQSYDWVNGGWGAAPKFPQPMTLEFLLRRAAGGDVFPC